MRIKTFVLLCKICMCGANQKAIRLKHFGLRLQKKKKDKSSDFKKELSNSKN